jgi:hypothetical protein
MLVNVEDVAAGHAPAERAFVAWLALRASQATERKGGTGRPVSAEDDMDRSPDAPPATGTWSNGLSEALAAERHRRDGLNELPCAGRSSA